MDDSQLRLSLTESQRRALSLALHPFDIAEMNMKLKQLGARHVSSWIVRVFLDRLVVKLPDDSARILSLQVVNDPSFWTVDGEPNKVAETALLHYAAAFPDLFNALVDVLSKREHERASKDPRAE